MRWSVGRSGPVALDKMGTDWCRISRYLAAKGRVFPNLIVRLDSLGPTLSAPSYRSRGPASRARKAALRVLWARAPGGWNLFAQSVRPEKPSVGYPVSQFETFLAK